MSSSSIGQRPTKTETTTPAYSSSLGPRPLVHDSPTSMSPGPSTHLMSPGSHRISDVMEGSLNHTDSGYATSNAQMGHFESDSSVFSSYSSHSPFYAQGNQDQILVSQSDSFILDLDTSPASIHTRFEGSPNMNHSQISTPSSFNSYFSAVAPQPLNIFSRPMNPSQYSKQIAAHGEHHEDEPSPQSSALEPPLTFCMSLFDGEGPMHDNLLNDPDPWNTVGKILNLNGITKYSSVPSSPERFSYDRHGVGYVPSIPEGQPEEPAQVNSPQKRFQQSSLTPEILTLTLACQDRPMIMRKGNNRNTAIPPSQDTTKQLTNDMEHNVSERGTPTIFVSTVPMLSPKGKSHTIFHNQNFTEELINDPEHERFLALSDSAPRVTVTIGEESLDAQGPCLFLDLDDDDE